MLYAHSFFFIIKMIFGYLIPLISLPFLLSRSLFPDSYHTQPHRKGISFPNFLPLFVHTNMCIALHPFHERIYLDCERRIRPRISPHPWLIPEKVTQQQYLCWDCDATAMRCWNNLVSLSVSCYSRKRKKKKKKMKSGLDVEKRDVLDPTR